MTRKEIQHLYQRAGLGISPLKLIKIGNRDRREIVDELFNSSRNLNPLTLDLSDLKYKRPGMKRPDKLSIKKFFEISQDRLRDYNMIWIKRLLDNPESLRERMVLFWANHFSCRDNNIFFVQQYNNTLRRHALGHFGHFVKAISKEPAMLKYLNNKQNVKTSPNENFARELMELFTLGTGQYTEKDIKESARAFTGYFHDFKGRFIIRPKHHDFGRKRFMGRRGNLNGDDIIDIILNQPECAAFLCRKIYKYFVNETINENHIGEMVQVFYPSYRIDELMRFVFESDWFYNRANIGTKIKSPIELLVGINTIVPLKFNTREKLIALQRLMGQILLFPSNVAGWQGGRSWIDVNSLLFRLKLPSLLLNNGYIVSHQNRKFDNNIYHRMRSKMKPRNRFEVEANWQIFEKNFNEIGIEEMHEYIIQPRALKGTMLMISDYAHPTKQEYCIQLMSLPEFQMC
ncbi:MAG: DUF1800 domain-containing protein [Flavobacteriaceae bacterium]|nr:DUF1800 domain-containing protein [Bacteroidia bacterium]MBT8288921.1 DUF1800 domain-containing protein [Bacteroidia bacterium]NNF74104.1 DUF1800 domain-containing protein [Flavobacteriaceae bacterium]NNK71813.1 DUF1800 domain-containing protein [Flavobacteriaceae bacterium]